MHYTPYNTFRRMHSCSSKKQTFLTAPRYSLLLLSITVSLDILAMSLILGQPCDESTTTGDVRCCGSLAYDTKQYFCRNGTYDVQFSLQRH